MPYRLNPLTGTLDYYQAGSTSNSFSTIQPISGTSPTAASPTDTLTLAGDGSVGITGNSSTDTVTYKVNWGVKSAHRPPVAYIDTSAGGLPGGSSFTPSPGGSAVVNGDAVLFAGYDGKVYTVSGVGSSLVWTLRLDGQAGDGSPSAGDFLMQTKGTYYATPVQPNVGFYYYAPVLGGWTSIFAVGKTLFGHNNSTIEVSGDFSLITSTNGLVDFSSGGVMKLRNYNSVGGHIIDQCSESQTTSGTTPATLSWANNLLPAWCPAHRPFVMNVTIAAYRTDTADTDYWLEERQYMMYWNGTTMTELANNTIGTAYKTAGASGWTAVRTGTGCAFQVTGTAGQTIQWKVFRHFKTFGA